MAVTTNKNFLSPVGFEFSIDNQRYPNLNYFCTGVQLPGISASEAASPYRGVNFAQPSDRLTYEDLSLTFNVTENMENYIESVQWLEECVGSNDDQRSDAMLHILSSHNNVTKEIQFIDCFPTALSGLEFNSQLSDIEYLHATLTLSYTYYVIK